MTDLFSKFDPLIEQRRALLATGLSMLVWYIFAPQCLATLAVMHRETNSWKIVGTAVVYLFGLAYLASFITYQVASLLTA